MDRSASANMKERAILRAVRLLKANGYVVYKKEKKETIWKEENFNVGFS